MIQGAVECNCLQFHFGSQLSGLLFREIQKERVNSSESQCKVSPLKIHLVLGAQCSSQNYFRFSADAAKAVLHWFPCSTSLEGFLLTKRALSNA